MSRSKIKKPKSPAIKAKLEEENKRRLAKLEARNNRLAATPVDPQLLGMVNALAGITDPSHAGLIVAFTYGLRLTNANK